MPTMSRRRVLRGGAAVLALASPRVLRAQSIPPQATIVLGFPPGSGGDIACRLYAEHMRGHYANALVVENVSGAGGRLGVSAVLRRPPDGRTLLFTPLSILTLFPHVYTDLDYNGFTDLLPLSSAARLTFALGIGPAVPERVDSLAAFLDWARPRPREATIGHPGIGTPQHLLATMLGRHADIALTDVPYRGSAVAATALLGGEIAAAMLSPGNLTSQQAGGRVRVLAVTSPERWPLLPRIPTMAENGFVTVTAEETFGFFAPRGVPEEFLARAEATLIAAGTNAQLTARLESLDLNASAAGRAALAAQLRRDEAIWKGLVVATGFRPG